MNPGIVCRSCKTAFVAPGDGGEAWFTCPHCGAREPNPLAQDRPNKPVPRFGIFSLLGTLLIVFGAFWLVLGSCGAIFAAVLSPFIAQSRITVIVLGSVLAVAGGVILLRLEKQAQMTAGKLAGQALIVAVLIALAAVTSLMFAVFTCFS